MRRDNNYPDVPSPDLAEVHAILLAALQRWDRRRRWLALLRGICEGIVVVVVGLGLTMAMDVVVNPWLSARWFATGIVALAGLTVLLLRGFIPALRSWDPVRVARHAERCTAIGDERISSALELIRRPTPGLSAWMIARTAAMAAQAVNEPASARIFPVHTVLHSIRSAGIALGVVVVLVLMPHGAAWLARALAPGLPLARPSRFQIEVDPGAARIARGTSVVITAHIIPPPQSAQVILAWEDGVTESLPMTTAGKTYVLALPAVSRSFQYRIRAETGESRPYAMTVLDPPALAGMVIRVIPPAYSGLPTRESADGDVEIIAGSRIQIQLTAPPQALRGVTVLRAGQAEVALQPQQDGRWMGQFLPENSQIYTLRVISADGMIVEPASRWFITVRADQPPEVAVTRAGTTTDSSAVPSTHTTSQAARDEVIPLTVIAADDNGLRECVLVVAAGGRELLRQDVLVTKTFTATRIEQNVTVNLARMLVAHDDRVQIHVEAVDQGGLRAVSASLTLELISTVGSEAAKMSIALRGQLAVVDGALAELRLAERTWTGLLRTFRSEDPAAQRGELLLLGARYAQLGTEVQQAALAVRAVAVRTRPVDHPAQDWILGVAVDLEAWVATQNDPLQRSIQDSTQATTRLGDVQRGRDLVESAHRALEPLRVALFLAIARLQLDVDVASVETALHRAEAADTLLKGWAIWHEQATESGLLLSVHAGDDGQGALVLQAVAVPTLDLIQKSGLAVHYAAHWQGELFIPATAMYRFASEVDDGIRLRCAGNDVFPIESWRSQAKTAFQGRVHLEAGWQPLTIDYFQAEGDAALALSWNREDQEPQAFTTAELRHRPTGSIPADLLAAMVAVTPTSVAQARETVSNSSAQVAEIALHLHRLAGESGRAFILEQAKQVDEPAARLRQRGEDPGPEQRVAAIADMHLVVRSTQQARDHLATLVDAHVGAGSPLARELAMVAQLQTRVEAGQRVRDALPTSDRDGVQRRELAAVHAGTVALVQRLAEFRAELVVRAGLADSVFAERLLLLFAREELAAMSKDSVATACQTVEEEVFALHDDSAPRFQRLVKALAQVATRLQEVEAILMQADDARFTSEIDRLLGEYTSSSTSLPWSIQPPADATRRTTDIREVVQHFRDHGRWQAARLVQQGMSGNDPRFGQENVPETTTVATVVKAPATVPTAVVLAQKALAQARQRVLAAETFTTEALGAEPVRIFVRSSGADDPQHRHRNFAREALQAADIAIRLATVPFAIGGPGGPGGSGSYKAREQWEGDMQQLAHDSGVVAQAIIPTIEAVRALEQRLLILMEFRPLAAVESPNLGAIGVPQFGFWARRLTAAVRDPSLRPAIIADMHHFITEIGTPAEPSPAIAWADAVDQGLERERATTAMEAALRDELSHASRQAAEVFTAAAERLEPRWSSERQHLSQAASEAARNAELARASATLPGAESGHLVAAILRARPQFLQDVLEPFARHVADDDDTVVMEVSEPALAISEAAHAQWDIAQRLSLLLAGHLRDRIELAHVLAGAEESVKNGETMADPALMEILTTAQKNVLARAADGTEIPQSDPDTLRAHLGEQQAIIDALSSFVDHEQSTLVVAQCTALLAQVCNTATTMAEVSQETNPTFSHQSAMVAQAAYQLAMRVSSAGVGESREVLSLLRAEKPVDGDVSRHAPASTGILAHQAAVISQPGATDAAWRAAAQALMQAHTVETLGLTENTSDDAVGDANGQHVHTPIPALILSGVPATALHRESSADIRLREWLRSAAEANRDVVGPSTEAFSPEYQQAIRAYFHRLMAEDIP